MNTIDNCFLSDLLHSVHSVPEVIHPEILRVLLSFHIPTLELRKCHHPSSIIHHPLSSSLFIFPPWNCVSFFSNCVSAIILNLHLPPRHVCDRMNCERERKRKGICSIFFSWISSQRKLIRLIDSPAHNIPLFLQPPLFHPTYGH